MVIAKSTYGILITLLGCPVLWSYRHFASVAASTWQAEYMALDMGTSWQVLWVRHLLTHILHKEFPGTILCNNLAAIRVSTDDSANKRVHHLDREFYLTNQALYNIRTELVWVPTKLQLADILTKSLTKEPFELFWGRIMSGG